MLACAPVDPISVPVEKVEPAGSFAVGSGPYAVRIGDLDADGVPDSLSANLVGESLSLLSGGSSGLPRWRTDLAAGGMAVALAVADFDGDGISDAAAAVRSRLGHLAWFHGREGTTPEAERTIPVYGTPDDVDAGDLDEDGRDEAVVAVREDGLVILHPSVSRWGEWVRIPGCSGATGYGPDGVSLADVDGDGHLDAIVACYETWSLHWLPGDGHGHLGPSQPVGRVGQGDIREAMRAFAPDAVVPAGEAAGGLRKAMAADLDGDGFADLIAVGDWGIVLVIFGGRDGFEPARTVRTGVDGTNNLAIGDLDEDGALEVMLLSGHETSALILSAASLREARVRLRRALELPKTPESLVLRDLDADGHLDLAVAGEHASAVQLLRGDGSGGFAPFDAPSPAR